MPHGLKPIAPPTVSTPSAPSAPPEPCMLCGAAVEAGQGVCRYCAMKRGLDRTLYVQARRNGRYWPIGRLVSVASAALLALVVGCEPRDDGPPTQIASPKLNPTYMLLCPDNPGAWLLP